MTSENARSLRLLVSLLSDRCEVRASTHTVYKSLSCMCMYVGPMYVLCELAVTRTRNYDGHSTSKLQV